MFSKRHYQAIADVLKTHNNDIGVDEGYCYYQTMDMIEMFERDNPKFDRARFLDACGLDQPEYKA
jgi:hypothetical protein